MLEKRLFSRIKSDSNAKLILNNQQLTGYVSDLSETGFSFVANSKVDFDFKAPYEFTIDLDGELLTVSVQIIWVEKFGKQYRYGMRYLAPRLREEYHERVRGLYERNNNGYFIFEVTVYLKDVNVFGTSYFSRYFDWQGMAREEYFMTVRNYEQIMSAGIKMITKKAWVDYENHSTIFDHIIMKIQNTNIKKYSFEMLFTYFQKDTGRLIATGGQKLVFANHLGKLIPIPDPILNVIQKHKIP